MVDAEEGFAAGAVAAGFDAADGFGADSGQGCQAFLVQAGRGTTTDEGAGDDGEDGGFGGAFGFGAGPAMLRLLGCRQGFAGQAFASPRLVVYGGCGGQFGGGHLFVVFALGHIH